MALYTLEQLQEAFHEGYNLGIEHGWDPAGPGKAIPGGHGAYDPYDPDTLWAESDIARSAGPHSSAQVEVVDRFTAATRDMARSA
jgi:hypothetical protein